MIEILFDLFLVGFPLLVVWKEKKFSLPVTREKARKVFSALGFRFSPKGKMFYCTVALFALMLALSFALEFAANALGMNDLGLVYERVSVLKGMPFLAAYLLSVRVTAEEVFFRGFLAKKYAVLVSSVLFALAHVFYGSIAQIMGAFVLGALLSAAFLVNKTIFPNILAHCGYNFVVLMLYG